MKLLQKVGWPLVALAAALLLWITFVASPELVSSVQAQVAYENMPADLEPASELPNRVYLEIRGPSARLRSVAESNMNVVIDLGGVRKAGEQTITLDRGSIDLPIGVSLVRAVPEQIRVRFERRIQADIPVKPRFSSQPPEGYRIAVQQVRPPTLSIAGPESRVRRLTEVETDQIDLANLAGKAQFRVHAYLDDPLLRFVSPPEVQVSVATEKAPPGGLLPDAKTTVRH